MRKELIREKAKAKRTQARINATLQRIDNPDESSEDEEAIAEKKVEEQPETPVPKGPTTTTATGTLTESVKGTEESKPAQSTSVKEQSLRLAVKRSTSSSNNSSPAATDSPNICSVRLTPIASSTASPSTRQHRWFWESKSTASPNTSNFPKTGQSATPNNNNKKKEEEKRSNAKSPPIQSPSPVIDQDDPQQMSSQKDNNQQQGLKSSANFQSQTTQITKSQKIDNVVSSESSTSMFCRSAPSAFVDIINNATTAQGKRRRVPSHLTTKVTTTPCNIRDDMSIPLAQIPYNHPQQQQQHSLLETPTTAPPPSEAAQKLLRHTMFTSIHHHHRNHCS